jgi:hypothetical protein
MPADSEWPAFLSDYQAAIAAFEDASRTLMAALTDRSATDADLGALLSAEEKTREAVLLARMRLINLWRESGADYGGRGGLLGEPSRARPQ